MQTEITEAVARKVLATIDAGLTQGVGSPAPGSMCVMAAINYALGHEHGDRPTCVGSAVRVFDIAINDAPWSSNEARAKGMRREAIAKLGSDSIDQAAFVSYVALHTIKRILPITLRAAGLKAEALLCEQADSLAAAESAARSAAEWAAARSAESAARSAAESAARSAEWAARSAARSARSADAIYILACDIATEALIGCGSEGVKWLWLCDGVRA